MARSFASSAKIVGASATPINFEYNQPFSVFCWFQVTAQGEQSFVGHLDTASGFRGWEIQQAPATLSNKLAFYIISTYPTVYIRRLTTVSSVAANTWFHFGGTYDGSHLAAGTHVYFNGLVADTAQDLVDGLGTNSITNSIVPHMGARNNGTNYLTGKMADVGVWNVVLTAGEIAGLYKGMRPYMVRPGALVAYWPLYGLSSPEPDLSGNANNGTLTGTAYANGPPVTLFTPKSPIFLPSVTTTPSILYGHNIGANFSRRITTIGY